jgi:murein L,D-transpeptidase YafK
MTVGIIAQDRTRCRGPVPHRIGIDRGRLPWRRALIGVALALLAPFCADAAEESWLFVDTVAETLEVVQSGQVKQTFHNIAIGRNGSDFEHREGDGRTPMGVFKVVWINPDSRFHLFFGLDYPSENDAEEAFRRRLIDYGTYSAIRKAHALGELPPQDTVLGGYIGIHGLGNASRFIHEHANWTRGCIALTNKQIDQLARWVSLGTQVVIY